MKIYKKLKKYHYETKWYCLKIITRIYNDPAFLVNLSSYLNKCNS